jgi:hypothetical protein
MEADVMKRALIAFLVSAGCASQLLGQVPPDRQRGAVDTVAAQRALGTFASLLAQQRNYQQMGFESAAEVRSATLGVSWDEYMVRLSDLKAYQAAQDPNALLITTARRTFPILVGGRTRSSLTLGADGRPVGFGSPSYVRMLDSLRSQVAQRDGGAVVDYFEVRVSALNTTFLGSRRNGQLFLTPLKTDSQYGFEAGRTLPANDALRAMVPAAQAHNGEPT